MAIVFALLTHVSIYNWGIMSLLSALAAFPFGIYLEVGIQVSPAHRVTSYAGELALIAMSYTRNSNKENWSEKKSKLDELMLEVKGKFSATTNSLVWDKRASGLGLCLAFLAVTLNFLEPLISEASHLLRRE